MLKTGSDVFEGDERFAVEAIGVRVGVGVVAWQPARSAADARIARISLRRRPARTLFGPSDRSSSGKSSTALNPSCPRSGYGAYNLGVFDQAHSPRKNMKPPKSTGP